MHQIWTDSVTKFECVMSDAHHLPKVISRERGNDPVLDQGVVHDLSVRALQERLAELERSEKEQSAETAQEFEFCARLEKQPEARRRHWSPNCSRKWRLSRVCT